MTDFLLCCSFADVVSFRNVSCETGDGENAGTNRQGCPVEYEYFGGGKIKKAFPYGKAFGMNDSGNQFPAVSLFCRSCKGAEYASVSLFGATSQDGFLTA